MVTQFVGKREAERITGLSHETLKKYRLQGVLIEGIHWVRQNQRLILYNALLLSNFIQNRNDPNQHGIAIEHYLRSLPSQAKVRSRKIAYSTLAHEVLYQQLQPAEEDANAI